MRDHPDKLSPEALKILAWSRVHDLIQDALEVGRIFDKVTSPMPDVVAVNGDPRELVIGYATLAAQAREDARKLFGHGW